MKGFAVTSKGIEEIAANDIKELINADSEIEEGCVVFEAKNFEDFCTLCYKCQSIDRVVYLLGSFEFEDFKKEFKKALEKTDFEKWMHDHSKFKAECLRLGSHDFKSVDAEQIASGFITEKFKNTKIDFNEFEIIVYSYIISNKCYFGIDFAGFELNKRSYKIFLHPSSLRGTIAYSLVRFSGFGKKEKLIDPFSRDGVVPIEAAFFALDFPYNYYKKDKFAFLNLKTSVDYDKFFRNEDKKTKKAKTGIFAFDYMFKFVDYSRKNAKIAGIDKQVEFSRTELEWLDIKFKKQSVDRIVASLPSSKEASLERIYNELFYQSEYILKKDGTVAVIAKLHDMAKRHAAKHNFEVFREKEVWSGEQSLKIIVFRRKSI